MRDADGLVQRVVETKKPGDATAEELEIREVNAGIYAFAGAELLDALAQVKNDNAQGEYYLPDVLPLLREQGRVVAAHVLDEPDLALGINDRGDLAAVRAIAQRRIHDRHLAAGVTIVDPGSTDDRRGRRDRPGHDDRALQLPARRDHASAPTARSARSPR